jgi:uncharacterized protein (TIGR00251 family)
LTRTPDRRPWRAGKDHIVLRVRVTPKSGRDAVEGVAETRDGSALQVRVRAAPEDGAANAALENLIARWLDVPRTSLSLQKGTRSRVKTIAIGGSPAELEARMAAKLRELI